MARLTSRLAFRAFPVFVGLCGHCSVPVRRKQHLARLPERLRRRLRYFPLARLPLQVDGTRAPAKWPLETRRVFTLTTASLRFPSRCRLASFYESVVPDLENALTKRTFQDKRCMWKVSHWRWGGGGGGGDFIFYGGGYNRMFEGQPQSCPSTI